MLHPVVALEHFKAAGIEFNPNTYIPEDSVKAKVIENIIGREARWLSRDKHDVLVGFDPTTDIQIGSRLVLNQEGDIDPTDITWINMSGSDGSQLSEMIIRGKADVIAKTRTRCGYIARGETERGWAMGQNEDGETVALCKNHIIYVTHVDRND